MNATRKWIAVICILAAANLIMTAVFLIILPDQVPVHFANNGDANRIGSKFENLFLPAMSLGIAVLSIADAKTNDRSNTLTVLKVGVAAQALFIGTGLFLFLNQLTSGGGAATPSAPANPFDAARTALLVLGVMLVVFGNLMPKTTRNSTFGIRLPWTLESDEAWQRAHRFGGYVSIACGAVALALAAPFAGQAASTATMVVLLAWAAISIFGSYFVCKSLR